MKLAEEREPDSAETELAETPAVEREPALVEKPVEGPEADSEMVLAVELLQNQITHLAS